MQENLSEYVEYVHSEKYQNFWKKIKIKKQIANQLYLWTERLLAIYIFDTIFIKNLTTH